MKLSVVVPAYNEEKYLAACLQAIADGLEAIDRSDLSTETIVVDNNSTDATASVADRAGATVVFEAINQISRARNAGAAAATGDWLLFVDADSLPGAGLFADVLKLIDSKQYIGCGSVMHMPALPAWARFTIWFWTRISIACSWAAGSFIVCRRDAFREIGGFSEELFVAEEIELSRKLKKAGRKRGLKFTILRAHPLRTSNRKLVLYDGREILHNLSNLILHPRKSLRDKKYLNVWYDGRR